MSFEVQKLKNPGTAPVSAAVEQGPCKAQVIRSIRVTMVTVFIRHRVKNYPKWKKVFDGFLPNRQAGGEISYVIGHLAKKTKNICLIFRWDSAANAAKFLKSKELKAAMKDSGIIEKPDVFNVEEKERGNTN